jgi:Bacterial regulatory proteins, luxR family
VVIAWARFGPCFCLLNWPDAFDPPGHRDRGSNSEIASEMRLSQGTVKIHVGRILAKLDLRDRVQAVVLAYESGLITPGNQEPGSAAAP